MEEADVESLPRTTVPEKVRGSRTVNAIKPVKINPGIAIATNAARQPKNCVSQPPLRKPTAMLSGPPRSNIDIARNRSARSKYEASNEWLGGMIPASPSAAPIRVPTNWRKLLVTPQSATAALRVPSAAAIIAGR
jgi:hypothetical protein